MADEVREINPGEALLQHLLQKTAKDRAASLRYNVRALALSYGTLAVVVLMGLLGVNVYVTGLTAVAGLLTFLFATWRQGKKLEQQFYQEELAYYRQLTATSAGGDAAPVTGGLSPSPSPADRAAVATAVAVENPLTQRETEILTLIAQGNMNKEIARKLGLSTNTIRNYTVQIMKKMEVDDRTAAAVLAISRGWIKN